MLTTATDQTSTYDVLPYPKWTHRETHPRQLEAVASLFGMRPAPTTRCRVLELGCAAGRNLLPIAEASPDCELVGIDLSRAQIDDALATTRELGLRNIEFRHGSILDIDTTWGRFDYIICHGVFSWVPREVQDAILEVCRANLAENGVALVSYNVYPGWHFHTMIRDMMFYHVGRCDDAHERVARAKSLIRFVADNCVKGDAYGRVMDTQARLVEKAQEAYLFHDHLEVDNHPLYFHQFVDRAAACGLQYVAETKVSNCVVKFLPKKAREALAGLPQIRQEQYLDFLRNRSFRKTLLCHAEAKLNRRLEANTMEGFEVAFEKKPQVETFDLENDSPAVFALNHGTFSTPNRFFKAALRVLLDAWPVPVPLVELRTRAKAMLTRCAADAAGTEGDLNRLVLDLVCAGPLEAFVHAPHFAATVSRLPSVPRLARIQAREGDHATNCRHEVITLDAFSRRFIQLLDGRHDRKALARNVQESLQAGELTLAVEGRPVSHRDRGAVLRLVDECLERLLGLSLLRS